MQLRDSISTVPCGALLAAGAQTSLAAETINLDAAPLNHALMNFATMCGITITVPADLARNRMSEPLRGKRCGEPALQRLLQGSGLSYRKAPNGGIAIVAMAARLAGRATLLRTGEHALRHGSHRSSGRRAVDRQRARRAYGYITSTSRPRTYGLTFRYSGR